MDLLPKNLSSIGGQLRKRNQKLPMAVESARIVLKEKFAFVSIAVEMQAMLQKVSFFKAILNNQVPLLRPFGDLNFCGFSLLKIKIGWVL